MKKKIFMCLVLAMCFLVGCGSSGTGSTQDEPEQKAYLDESEIDKAYGDPDSYKGKYITIGGIVFGEPDVGEDGMAFQMYADPINYGKNTVVYFLGDADITVGDYVMVDGMIRGAYEYTSVIGAEVTALLIETENVRLSDYIECCAPTIKEVVLEQTIDQKGYCVTVEKVEFAETETRLYLTVTNNGTDEFSVAPYNIKIVQNQKQYEYQYNFNYEEVQTNLLPNTSTSGIVVFPPMDSEAGFTIYCDPYCGDWYADLEDYVFEYNN